MTSNEMISFGERVRRVRDGLGLTQDEVAEAVNITPRFYQMVERGEKGVSLETLIRLTKLFHTSADYMLFGTLPGDMSNPVVHMFEKMSSRQREDATKILELYVKRTRR